MSKEEDLHILQQEEILKSVLARNSLILLEAGLAEKVLFQFKAPEINKYDPPLGADLLFSATRITKSIRDHSGHEKEIVHYGIMYSINEKERYFVPVGAVYLEEGESCRVVEGGFTEDDLNLVRDMVDYLIYMKESGELPNLDSLYLMNILDPQNP